MSSRGGEQRRLRKGGCNQLVGEHLFLPKLAFLHPVPSGLDGYVTVTSPLPWDGRFILEVADLLTVKTQVRKLGITLGLEAREVDSILENNKDNINEAAYKVLQKWFQGQTHRTTAYVHLNNLL